METQGPSWLAHTFENGSVLLNENSDKQQLPGILVGGSFPGVSNAIHLTNNIPLILCG